MNETMNQPKTGDPDRTPGDAVREELAVLGLNDADIAAAIRWARENHADSAPQTECPASRR